MSGEVSIADVCAFLESIDETGVQEPPEKRLRCGGSGAVCQPVGRAPRAPKAKGEGGEAKKVHECTWENCGKSFSSRWGLDRHYRIHTGEKPWVCQVEGCGKGFVDRALLTRHERTHSKERPFLCPHPGCMKAFKVQKHLEYHMQLHTQPDLFNCGIDGCLKNFSNPSSLRIHRLLDHESPDHESGIEKQLREELNEATAELEKTKELLAGATQALTATQGEARELKKQSKAQQPRLHGLRRENEVLAQHVKQLADGSAPAQDAPLLGLMPAPQTSVDGV